MASMSDIAFLLIIFFVVSMSFMYSRGMAFRLPKIDDRPLLVNNRDLLVLDIDQTGRLLLAGREIDRTGLAKRKERAVILTAHPEARYSALVRAVEMLHAGDISRISLKVKK